MLFNYKYKHNYYLVKHTIFKNDVYYCENLILVKKIPKSNKLNNYVLIKQVKLTKKEAKNYMDNIIPYYLDVWL